MKTTDLRQLMSEFLEALMIERNVSRYTVRNYTHYLRRFLDWLRRDRGEVKADEVTLDLIRKYRLYLSRLADVDGKGLLIVTQSYHLIALRSWLKWLIKQDIATLAPEKIDLPKVESRRLEFLTRAQVDRLLSMPGISREIGLRDKAILEVLFSTGMRVSELTKLNRDQLNFDSREIGVIGKGGKARVVFLSERATMWLRRYLNFRQDRWKPVFIRYSGSKVQVTSKEGEEMRFTPRGVQRVVEKYRRRAGLAQKITPHGLRHSFATDLLQAGAGLREVQEMLGHKNVSTTQIYTHVTNPQLKRVHEKYHQRPT